MTEQTIIVGAGHGAGQIVTTLKQKRYAGRIVLIGEEAWLPYQRPPLSKKYLSGELPATRLYLKPAAFYDDPGIEVRLNTRVERIDREAQRVVLDNGTALDYSALVLATGSRARRLNADGAGLAAVHYLRGIDDVDRIRAGLKTAKRVVIVGAGYIGLEVAAVVRTAGHDVVVVEMTDRVMSRVVAPELSAFYEDAHQNAGVELLFGTGVEGFAARDGRLSGVRLSNGRTLPADLVIVGIGILPNVELAAAAGLAVDDGIVVDRHCRTADAAVYAVGDCTSHPSRLYGRRLRLESVHNALEQAKTAAINIAGGDASYDQVPWFWSDQYDLKLQIAGLATGFDKAVLRGDRQQRAFSCAYLKEGRLIAIDAVNAPKDFMQAKALIAAGARPEPAALADPAIELKQLTRSG